MNNFPAPTNFEKKITNPRTVTALTSTATVNIDFTNPLMNTLTLTQHTTFNVTGSYVQGDSVDIFVTGNFDVFFIQSTFIFRGVFLSSGFLQNYNGSKLNEITIECINASTKEFTIICNPLST